MSDTESMVRLMLHAAKLMGDRVEVMTAKAEDHQVKVPDVRNVAALAYGRGVLEMVAASVAPEGLRRTEELITHLHADYDDWADANDGVRMSPGEIESIARFLRGVREDS